MSHFRNCKVQCFTFRCVFSHQSVLFIIVLTLNKIFLRTSYLFFNFPVFCKIYVGAQGKYWIFQDTKIFHYNILLESISLKEIGFLKGIGYTQLWHDRNPLKHH